MNITSFLTCCQALKHSGRSLELNLQCHHKREAAGVFWRSGQDVSRQQVAALILPAVVGMLELQCDLRLVKHDGSRSETILTVRGVVSYQQRCIGPEMGVCSREEPKVRRLSRSYSWNS